MAENMECEICGGTDFYKEAGYFYCNECQTQSQEVREHVFQEEVAEINLRSVRKIKNNKKEKLDNKITSWECYNIVMSSLTGQLINLGADKNLKPIVKCLWMKYLQKLEVLDLKRDAKPRLQLINSTRDLNILYGKPAKRKRRKKSSDESSISHNSSSIKRERTKKKRQLAEAHYEEFSQKSNQESTSLHNETLTSLKSQSDQSEKSGETVCFNRYSVKELKKKISKNQNLESHKLIYKNCSNQYARGIHYLSPIKLYSILYLGLLINRDQIQLGDLFRFIREGHLTFNNYTELFPEEYLEKFLNIQSNGKNNLFSSKYFRITTAKMAVFLNVSTYIKVVDLTQLCQRFCREMNLPDDIYTAVRNILSKANPKLSFTSTSKTIPNYEGRAMSIILFTLKLLFGFDGVTEFELSKYAQSLNKLNLSQHKMFDIIQWMEYIRYRHLLISEHHFPSMYMENSNEIDSDKFLQYIESQEVKLDEYIKLTKEMKGYEELLTNIINSQNNSCVKTKFAPTLTPYLEYFQTLDSSNHNFNDNSLDFLLKPNQYLSLVNDNVQLKHGGANDDWILEDLKTYRTMKTISKSNLRVIPIQIIKSGNEKNIDETKCSKPKMSKKKLDPCYVQKTYDKCRKHVFNQNEIHVNRISKEVKLNNENKINGIVDSDCYKIHYMPYERYWLYLQMNIDLINKKDFDTFFDKHTSTFKLVLNECARIIEQTVQEFLFEFQFSELYLIYSATYGKTSDIMKKQTLLDRKLKCYVNQAKRHW